LRVTNLEKDKALGAATNTLQQNVAIFWCISREGSRLGSGLGGGFRMARLDEPQNRRVCGSSSRTSSLPCRVPCPTKYERECAARRTACSLSSCHHQEKPQLLICSHKLEYAKVYEKSADISCK